MSISREEKDARRGILPKIIENGDNGSECCRLGQNN